MTAKENAVPPYVNTGETIGFPPSRDEVERVVRRIAGNILHHTKRSFVEAKSGSLLVNLSGLTADENITLADPYCDWKYWNGVIYIGMKRLGEELHHEEYVTYGAQNFTFIFKHLDFFKKRFEKRIPDAPFHQYFRMDRLDDCGAMGAALLETLPGNNNENWQQRIEQTADYIMNKQERLADGTFARCRFGKTTLWADDLYMSVPFLAGMYSYSGNDEYLREAARQVLNFHKRLFEPFRGLYYHTWYLEEETFGVAFWGRANGWAAMAKCHLLDVLPAEDPDRTSVLKTLREQITGFSRYQSADGTWRQLTDKADSWAESSSTAM
ncbi:MAG TPA: glycoside hydrolase family 88 protein, partial [Bacteroidales bacterium]|nr:glycoside hydrolase family 88 protein [Bacteroidales bacterium]